MKAEPSPPEALGRREAAAMLGISVTTFWRLSKEPDFPRPIRIRSMNRWLPDELREWVRRTQRAA
jgi:predicted DNA-binding transcriptional regulator AlpA